MAARIRARQAAAAALVLAFALPAWGEGSPSPADVEGPFAWGSVQNVTRLGNLYFAGQPDAAGFEAAREAGVSVVIDLRHPSERDWDESAAVSTAGMAYHNVPVHGADFDPSAFARIAALVAENSESPILIHCSSSNRAGAWLATHLAEQHGSSEADALAVGRRAGITKQSIEEKVGRYHVGRRARRALAPLKKNLIGALKGALAESPEAALQACQLAAPSITAGAASHGVELGRTSHRTRNPANAPQAWMQAALDRYAEAPIERLPPAVVDLGSRGMGYVEPIYLQEMCETCHGADVDSKLLTQIRAQYPEDRAVGFRSGEFRGLFWAVQPPGI